MVPFPETVPHFCVPVQGFTPWPEDVRLDFVLQLADDPWLSDKVEQFALSDSSAKVKWNVARRLSWYGYTERVERLLQSLDDTGFRESVRALDPDEIPKSQWPRAVNACEQMHKEASDPFERLRLLRVLQTFGGTNIVERMKAELDGLGPDQLKPGETQGQIRWCLDDGFLYLEAVTTVDPTQADGVILELIRSQQYEHVLAQRLPLFARKSKVRQGFGTNRMDFKKIWKSRAGEPDEAFVEDRRVRFADEIRGQIDRIKGEREAATDRSGFDYRQKILGGSLAALDGKRSAKLILELMELPGRWDGWTRVGAIESLLSWGVQLSLEEVLRVLDPVIQELRASGIYSDNQNAWLFARCLSVMAFVDPPAAGIAKIRELISELRFRLYELGGVVAALGASRCDDAIDVLMEFAGADGKGAEAVGESWLESIGGLEGARANEILLSFVDPNVKLFNREFIPDHRCGDLLARLLAERAAKEKTLKARLVELANGDLPRTKRMLLAKAFGQLGSEEDRVLGLCILRDDGSGIPYELFHSMEEAFLERRPYGPGSSTVTLVPRGSNALRKRLFEMSQKDPLRKRSAFALLGQIEVWRLEYGRPNDEPRHPAVDLGEHWPPLRP